ncbi:acyl-CoA synthetase [Mesorhizobium sp. J428]|uniref:acyl-CoA synthetase n=1 Tax=Mesorhizobium sp. J428 TaxID=2898440 RepID=UPI002150A4E7|nr:AMP-binding protein [Mesorhizobium sp. J428]MCR5856423.1 AMP-binding protein [Mesorhizobium sp. J428]
MARLHEPYDKFYGGFRWQVPAEFNFGVDVVDRIAREADGPALIAVDVNGGERRYAYSDIARLSDGLAAALRRKGVKKGDFVLVMLPRIPEWQISIVALLKLGAIPIPCIEMLTAKDVDYRVRNSGARAAICRADHAAKFDGLFDVLDVRISVGTASGWDDFAETVAQAPDGFAAAVVAAEDPAIMYYTSGSTGNPKGVLHASRALYSWWVSAAYWLDLQPGDVIWCTADTGWSKAGTSILFGPWARGACSLFYDGPFEPGERLRLLERYNVNVYCAPATELLRVAEQHVASFDLSALRQTVSAGEAVSPVIAERWLAATGMPISEAYGQTESLMIVLNYPGETVKPGSMGRPAPGSRVEVIDKMGNIMPDREEGDIALLTPHPQLMLGYWREPDRTERCFVDGPEGRWYVTGDRGARDANGYIWYRGRLDDIINSAGYRIGPTEVENALLDHPDVAECAAIGKPDALRGEIVKAFVVLRAGREGEAELVKNLQEHCKRLTAPYKYPREIAFVESLPKTLTGKIRRSELRDRESMAGQTT